MTHAPRRVYGYNMPPPPPPPPPPPQATKYCYDDADPTCMGEFSESEGMSDAAYVVPPGPDVTEIYRRKTTLPHELYHHPNVYYPSDYYYENVTTTNVPTPQVRRTIAATPGAQAYLRRRLHDERIGRYYNYTTEQIQEAYDTVTFRSTPQISSVRRASPTRLPSATVIPPQRRHPPVTIRTPRYYRRAPATVLKRPSALCLPVACQRDPAVYRRGRKLLPMDQVHHSTAADQKYPPADGAPKTVPQSPRADSQVAGVIRTDSGGDLNITNSDLDAVLARYEKIIRETVPEEDETKEGSASGKTSERHVHTLKPRVPSSIKAKHERLQKLKAARTAYETSKHPTKDNDRVEVEEITTEVLDNLLDELLRTGCENKIDSNLLGSKKDGKSPRSPVPMSPASKKDKIKDHIRHTPSKLTDSEPPKSVNYQEMTEQLVEMQRDSASNSASEKNQNVKQYPANLQEQLQEQLLLSRTTTRPSHTSLFESPAVQLHRSKSYIVNLIDRALSKELGTVPEPRYPKHKDHCNLNEMEAKAAVDMMNRHFEGKIDKELHAEITQALTESFVNNHVCRGHAQSKDPLLEVCCSCNSCGGGGGGGGGCGGVGGSGGSGEEEPLYLKQLKVLRWGHLKKIQKEVRRLEDIERFLDSCSSRTNF